MKKLSFIIGLVVAFILVIFGIVFDMANMTVDFTKVGNFADLPSVIITIGGTIATLVAAFPFSAFAQVPAHFGIIMGKQKYDPIYYIDIMSNLSQEARRKGLLSLEDTVAEYDDVFLKESIMLIVDAMDPDKVRERMDSTLANIENRHGQVWSFYDRGGALAPGFGMIGTLIGLVNMLKSMDFEGDGGASKLAQDMSVALITTFYGSLLANVVFQPISSQLQVAHNKEMLCKEIIVEGIISIQAGENPRHVREKLLSYMTFKQRSKLSDETETESSVAAG